jgi:hypothetical protein
MGYYQVSFYIFQVYTLFIALITSVTDPDHFDADPDPDHPSEITGCGSGSDHALYKML